MPLRGRADGVVSEFREEPYFLSCGGVGEKIR